MITSHSDELERRPTGEKPNIFDVSAVTVGSEAVIYSLV